MKIGDKVIHKKHEGIATVIQIDVQNLWDDIKQRHLVKTKYIARYEGTGHLLNFNGYDIGKTIFKYDRNVQLSFFDDI